MCINGLGVHISIWEVGCARPSFWKLLTHNRFYIIASAWWEKDAMPLHPRALGVYGKLIGSQLTYFKYITSQENNLVLCSPFRKGMERSILDAPGRRLFWVLGVPLGMSKFVHFDITVSYFPISFQPLSNEYTNREWERKKDTFLLS